MIVDLCLCIDKVSIFLSQNLFLAVWKIVCGSYTNWTYVFATPTCLWKIITRVLVGYLQFKISIYWIESRKYSQEFLVNWCIYSFITFRWFHQWQSCSFVVTLRLIPRGAKSHWVDLSQNLEIHLGLFCQWKGIQYFN